MAQFRLVTGDEHVLKLKTDTRSDCTTENYRKEIKTVLAVFKLFGICLLVSANERFVELVTDTINSSTSEMYIKELE